ncbi:putative ribosome biogenesis GTPase RsgA [bacterium BMS3Abin04]|nr:putative ribosome biogenesis GTPase RsgA [bacterium BMS3Abin04]
MSDDNVGVIEGIKDRKNYLSRKTPRIKGLSFRGQRFEQIIASNLDKLFLVSSVDEPKFNNKVIDRIIVAAESSQIDVVLVINKIDLLIEQSYIVEWKHLYEGIGYKVVLSSAAEGAGIDELLLMLKNKVNIFWGQSGVGKSSLLNKMFPQLNFKVGDISEYSNKGKHTTVTSNMVKVSEGTYIIDTPGIREIDPYGIKKEDLGHYFREFLPFIHNCKFNSCTHYHEPGCAVHKAVEDEKISIERYESYLSMLATVEDEMNF